MAGSSKKGQGKIKNPGVETFPVALELEEIQKNISILTNAAIAPSKEQLINQAFQYHSAGNFQEAEKYYQLLINQGFSDHRVLSNYGSLLKSLGKLKEAELYLRKAIELNPNYANAHYNLGNILNEIGKSKEAEISLRKAIELKPDFPTAHSNLGNVLSDQGKLKEAEILQRKAIELNPDLANAHYNLGNILMDIGNFKEAELFTRKAIELEPNFAEAHSNLGILFKAFGKLKEADLSTRKAIQIKHDLPNAHLNLGIILIEFGNLQGAEASIRKAIKLNPNLSDCYQNLSLLLYSKGQINLAVENIEKALSIDPISNSNQLLRSILLDKKCKQLQEISNPIHIEMNKQKNLSYPIILNRVVEPELINSLYKIEVNDLNKFQDPSYGNARGSDYQLFEHNEKITQTLKKDLISLAKGVVNSDVFFHDSFFTILSGSSIIKKHNHIVSHIDKFPGLNLWTKKYSLVYYLRVGDQDCKHPGILKFYPDKDNNNPSEEILPSEGLIVIFPADRYHSVMYDGTKDRIIIGVNFYSI
tara:strand:+ start:308 stop:1903 length:1596 start_codon:yes stop_codon:yes gene_type:complete